MRTERLSLGRAHVPTLRIVGVAESASHQAAPCGSRLTSAAQVLGDETLRAIARELVETVRGNVTIDWTLRENVRAQLRVLVRRILRKHGYPPDKQEQATVTVLEQAEVLSEGWAAA